MKIKYLHFSILIFLIFLLFGTMFTNNAFACSRSRGYYDVKASNFFKSAEIVFIGKVVDHNNYPYKKISEPTKVSFEILKQYKGEKAKKVDVYRDDYSTCDSDIFLMEAENNQIFVIMASKNNLKMKARNKNKFTIVGDYRNNKIFEIESKAEEFIKEVKEINEKKSESGFFMIFIIIWNWFLSLF